MIRIVIVDDSETETLVLKQTLANDRDIQIVGRAKDGVEAVRLAQQLHPDLMTMDLHMPNMDGLEAIRIIMANHPIPIIVISSQVTGVMDLTFRALEAGALSVIEKPTNIAAANFKEKSRRIVETIRIMSEIKVIKRRFHKKIKSPVTVTPTIEQALNEIHIIAIGTSVGGPQALKKILSNLPKTFPVPIVVVQHMAAGFMDGFTKWLDNTVPLTVKQVDDNELLEKGIVYFAPDGRHFGVERIQGKFYAHLVVSPPVSGFCPSATVLLRSVANCAGKNALGILLTGMGSDGADGLLALKQAHGHTIIQDSESTVVFGMAGVAQSLGAVDRVVEIDKIAEYLIEVTKR